MRNTSQILRDKIKVVRLDVSVARNFHMDARGYEGAFAGVKKFVWGYDRLSERYADKEWIKKMKATFGKDAELIDSNGKGYVAED